MLPGCLFYSYISSGKHCVSPSVSDVFDLFERSSCTFNFLPLPGLKEYKDFF